MEALRVCLCVCVCVRVCVGGSVADATRIRDTARSRRHFRALRHAAVADDLGLAELRQRTRPRDGQYSATIGHALDGQVAACVCALAAEPRVVDTHCALASPLDTAQWPRRAAAALSAAPLRRRVASHWAVEPRGGADACLLQVAAPSAATVRPVRACARRGAGLSTEKAPRAPSHVYVAGARANPCRAEAERREPQRRRAG